MRREERDEVRRVDHCELATLHGKEREILL